MSLKPIQLGIVALTPELYMGSIITISDWVDLDVATFEKDAAQWAEQDRVESLLDLMRDSSLQMRCEQQQRRDGVLIRIAVTPDDDDRWISSTRRTSRLKKLFKWMERGWEDPEDLVLDSSPEDLGTNMQALYALIESPPEPSFGPGQFSGDNEAFENLTRYENPIGVKTLMYKYQIRSVARMLHMETQPGSIVDPSYTAFSEAGTGNKYYIDLLRMNIRRHPETMHLSRGGILCEQMGVGKTLICLALVVTSRHQPTLPPENNHVSEPITDVSLRTYPTPYASAFRDMIGLTSIEVEGTPSLASLCVDTIARNCPAARWAHGWPLSDRAEKLLEERKCVYYRFPPPVRFSRSAKVVPFVPFERFILAPTTLVVVPPILMAQWIAEAETHLEEGAIRMLVIDDTKEPLPPIHKMIQYDIVLMSLTRFQREGRRDPEQPGPPKTELLKARWKRLILGNIAARIKSDAIILSDTLSIERRWIVSGTPTTGLKQGTEDAMDSFLHSDSMARVNPGMTFLSSERAAHKTRWTKRDIDDVDRLGNMIAVFLSSDAFKVEEFRRLVTKPLRNSNKPGPAYGAVSRIRAIMSAVMVKHRPGVIAQEVKLPPSTVSAEMVHFTHWQRLTYNALTALVASNVYTSGMEDSDYFLHPKNTEAFRQVVYNLHLACLWFSSPEMDLDGAIERTESHLKKKAHRLSEEQKAGLYEALRMMREALETPGWAEWMRNNSSASLPYNVPELPLSLLDAWSDCPDSVPELVDAFSLRHLGRLNRRGGDIPNLCRAGWDERAKQPQAEALLKLMDRAEKEWRRGRDQGAPALEGTHHRKDTKAAADKPKVVRGAVTAVKRPGATNGASAGARRRGNVDNVDDVLDLASENAARAADASSQRPRPLPPVISTCSRSAKVNRVLQSILSAALEDKFVIFGAYEEIAHVTEALDLVGIDSVYAGAHAHARMREKALRAFASDEIRVCLLELKYAARGLTLTLANRMIFLSPVWSLDVQAQAIKRIHRIGQTRPTHIEILVTEGTFEEDIVRRESSARSNVEEQVYSRALIERPRFVYGAREHTDDSAAFRFPIRLLPPGTQFTPEEAARYTAARAAVPALVGTRAGIPVPAVHAERRATAEPLPALATTPTLAAPASALAPSAAAPFLTPGNPHGPTPPSPPALLAPLHDNANRPAGPEPSWRKRSSGPESEGKPDEKPKKRARFIIDDEEEDLDMD